MYTIEFYEDMDGKSGLSDFMYSLRDRQNNDFYKIAAFLDYLAEKGVGGDKAVCRYPEGTIYMHCIPGISVSAAETEDSEEEDETAVCVILYGQYCEDESEDGENNGGGNTLVLLHHYFADKVPTGVPLLQMYRAVRELQKHRRT